MLVLPLPVMSGKLYRKQKVVATTPRPLLTVGARFLAKAFDLSPGGENILLALLSVVIISLLTFHVRKRRGELTYVINHSLHKHIKTWSA